MKKSTPTHHGRGNADISIKDPSLKLSDKQVLKFLARIDRKPMDECWPWMAGRNATMDGVKTYGVVWFNSVKHSSHRIAYRIFSGEIKEGRKIMICHSCDNPVCCNPGHLFQGTGVDNANDCKSKGRKYIESGSRRYNAKLTEDDVKWLREQSVSRRYGWLTQMAKKFGVTKSTIGNAISGFRWKQIDGPLSAGNGYRR